MDNNLQGVHIRDDEVSQTTLRPLYLRTVSTENSVLPKRPRDEEKLANKPRTSRVQPVKTEMCPATENSRAVGDEAEKEDTDILNYKVT